MSISSISSSQTYQVSASNATKSSSLSSEQKTLVEDVLSQYDAESLSKDDAKAIVEAFTEAGIEPSKALESAMSASGFDAQEIGTLAEVGKGGGGRPMGPPPPPAEEEVLTITELLESLLEEAEENEATTSSATTASTSPYEDTSSFTAFNTILDYTNQIVNLKDDAKSEVMSILEEYNASQEQQDAQKSVVNSLNDILNKPQNYNRISFYV